jgi:hypothetical protein
MPNFVASTTRSPEERLGLRPAVDVGGVEERHAGVEGGVHNAPGALLVDAATEVVTAEAHDADLQGADRAGFHRARCYR